MSQQTFDKPIELPPKPEVIWVNEDTSSDGQLIPCVLELYYNTLRRVAIALQQRCAELENAPKASANAAYEDAARACEARISGHTSALGTDLEQDVEAGQCAKAIRALKG